MFIATGLGTQPAHADPRNILLLIADDFGADVAKFFPTSARKETTPPAPLMPNLQALARKGVMFARAWADPWCSPTRATILTGRYGFRTGIGRPNVPGLPDLGLGEVTLPEVFRAAASADYVLANLGKWHLSSAADDPNRQGWTRYAGGHPDLGKLPSYYDWPKTVDGVTTASTTYATTETVDEALAVIDQAEREDRPYFLWVGFNAPHDPNERPPDQLISRHDLPATGAPARTYFDSMVEAMDTEIGRLPGAVNLANTTVIFLGDNGTAPAVTAPPYSATKAKGTMYQGGVHVPLFISGAGVMRWGRQEIALVNTTDLFPAILQLAGINLAHPALAGVKRDGVSLMPYLEDRPHPSPRWWAYAEQFTTRYDREWERAIRNWRYVLIERFNGSREFYDLTDDPLQKTNLLKRTLTSSQRTRLNKLDYFLDTLLATR